MLGACLCVFMCCLCVRARAYVYYVCTFVHTYKHTRTLNHTYARACVRARTHTQTNTQTHTNTHARTHMITSSAPPGRMGCSNTHVVCVRAHVHMSAHIDHTCPLCISRAYRHVHRCARACICTHAYEIHVYTD